MPTSSPTSAEASTGNAKDSSPYWNDFTKEIKLRIVVAHRDRLARFGFELIEWLAHQNGGSVLVIENQDASPESELTQDILAILDTFSCRLHGLRRYRKAIQEDQTLPRQETETSD